VRSSVKHAESLIHIPPSHPHPHSPATGSSFRLSGSSPVNQPAMAWFTGQRDTVGRTVRANPSPEAHFFFFSDVEAASRPDEIGVLVGEPNKLSLLTEPDHLPAITNIQQIRSSLLIRDGGSLLVLRHRSATILPPSILILIVPLPGLRSGERPSAKARRQRRLSHPGRLPSSCARGLRPGVSVPG
jgi:hypothetical protein